MAIRWKRIKDWEDGILLSSLPEPIRGFAYVACPCASVNRKGERAKGDDQFVFWKIDVAEPVDIAKYLRKVKINAKKTKQKASQKAGNKEAKGKA